MEPTFIDFEASSLNLIESYPIEVGICPPSGEPVSWLIQPHVLWKDWSESAERVHGIRQEALQQEGLQVSRVTQLLNQHLSGTVYCDAWTFDSFWLHRLYKAAKVTPTFKLESIATLLNEDQVQLWQETRKTIIEQSGIDTHRAANDARILHLTWCALQAR